MIEIQDILHKHGGEYFQKHTTSPAQSKAFRDICICRTAALGGYADTCGKCAHQVISYNSCRNRHCPKCQAFKKEQWIEKQEQHLLDAGYFHAVFTLPDELNPIVYQNQEVMYSLFFKAVSETLLELGANKRYLGAKLGFTAVLHTWGQNLLYHPHIHCVVPGGRLTMDGKWRYSRKKFFIPLKVLSNKFRGKFMAYFRQARLNFYGTAADLNIPGNFDCFAAGLYRKNWIVY